MDELEETRALLRDVVTLFKQEQEEHHSSMLSFRTYFGELLKHHIEEMSDIYIVSSVIPRNASPRRMR